MGLTVQVCAPSSVLNGVVEKGLLFGVGVLPLKGCGCIVLKGIIPQRFIKFL